MLAGHEDLLRELTEGKPGITLAELQASLVERGAPKASLTAIWTLLRKLGV